MTRPFEIFTDGRTIWINGEDGMCIGRFSRFGVDVHDDAEGQVRTGKQCLECVHDLPPEEAWPRFREAMQRHWSIEVPEDLRPSYAAPRSQPG